MSLKFLEFLKNMRSYHVGVRGRLSGQLVFQKGATGHNSDKANAFSSHSKLLITLSIGEVESILIVANGSLAAIRWDVHVGAANDREKSLSHSTYGTEYATVVGVSEYLPFGEDNSQILVYKCLSEPASTCRNFSH